VFFVAIGTSSPKPNAFRFDKFPVLLKTSTRFAKPLKDKAKPLPARAALVKKERRFIKFITLILLFEAAL